MCGISAIISKKDENISDYKIRKVTDFVSHRGPYGSYYFGKNFALGHKRLSIIDLSEYGSQPMVYENDYVITFNGAIYKHIELRKEFNHLVFIQI